MIEPVEVRGVRLGVGRSKICIPLSASSRAALMDEARQCLAHAPDLFEWRADFFEHLPDAEACRRVLADLRAVIGDIPVVFTVRTVNEGGEAAMDGAAYADLLCDVAAGGGADIVDVEVAFESARPSALIDGLRSHGVPVIASHHDFKGTPTRAAIVGHLCHMQDLGADICKFAVMPDTTEDVLTLLDATRIMAATKATRPLVTMSMGRLGLISRIAGGLFGSSMTFASGARASAPGQIPVDRLRSALALFEDER